MVTNNDMRFTLLSRTVYNRHGLLNPAEHAKKMKSIGEEKDAIMNRMKEMGVQSFSVNNFSGFDIARAANFSAGVHLTITHDFFDQMMEDPDFKERIFNTIRAAEEHMRAGDAHHIIMELGIWDENMNRIYGNASLGEDCYITCYDKKGEMFEPFTAADFMSDMPVETLTELFAEQFAVKASYLADEMKDAVVEKSTPAYTEAEPPAELPLGTATIGTEGHTTTRWHSQWVTIEHEGTQWDAVITPDGVFMTESGWESRDAFVKLDIAANEKGLPADVLKEWEAISNMLAHMPVRPVQPFGNLVIRQFDPAQSGETQSVFQSEATPKTPEDFLSFLQEEMKHLTQAFTQVYNDFEGESSAHLESAFFHMLNNTRSVFSFMSWAGANRADDELTERSLRPTFQQQFDEAQAQLNQFGQNFLAKFRQYGFDDGFNVAWAMFVNDHAVGV